MAERSSIGAPVPKIDLSRHESLGTALAEAYQRFAGEICLIEADRERENHRLTYEQFRGSTLALAGFLATEGFGMDSRAAIVMTNQSKWLMAAAAIFHRGGVLVPIDYKLMAEEQVAILQHSRSEILVTEYPFWRAMVQSAGYQKARSEGTLALRRVIITEGPRQGDLFEAVEWERAVSGGEDAGGPAVRRRSDWACIVYSSGTGGQPKGCVLTHDNYLEQCLALTSLYPFWPGVRYLSILPTNHAIDFMVGFIGPFVCGATVVHLRTLRPEYVREAFSRFKITYVALVPLILRNLQIGLEKRFAELPPAKRGIFGLLRGVNRWVTRKRPQLALSRRLLRQVHDAFGGELRAIFTGGAFSDPAMLQFFYDLGIQVGNGYGLTEAGTALTLNDFAPFRADTVGRPLPGVELRIDRPDADGIGQVVARSRTVMSHYLDNPDLTAETIVDGWLQTGDLGRIDGMGHLQLFGRIKNMIVTEEGKNVYPEDIESVFAGLPIQEFCVFAANYIWPERSMMGEKLVLVLHFEPGEALTPALEAEISERNRRLLNFKRVSGLVVWEDDFPRTASMKIKRAVLAEQIRQRCQREEALRALD
jgi:long-chain acyl-CoA synthetase